jgi:hypothetical protein
MADEVYLSLWLRDSGAHATLRHYQRLLERFPFSRLRPGLTLRIYAMEFAEPPALEHRFEGDVAAAEVIAAAREFENPDCAYQVEAYWDLLQHERDWELAPSAVTLTCFGPEFASDQGEQLLLQLGHDSLFLPESEAPAGFRAIQSNIRSLLHLASDLEEALPVERRMLWSESGENLAEQLAEMLEEQ